MKSPAPHKLILKAFPPSGEGLSVSALAAALGEAIPRRSLQRQLGELVQQGLLARQGTGRATVYAHVSGPLAVAESVATYGSPAAAEAISAVRRPLRQRKPVGYESRFLEDYRPNKTHYLSSRQRAQLHAIGRPPGETMKAGTFAQDILDRLLIDLSFASSQLEGNTYSLLDTRRLIEQGHAAQGKDALETQMILNHKEAIEFLVRDPSCAQPNATALKSLHALLADGLLGEPAALGRLRQRAVGISGSSYLPPALGDYIEEMFELLVAKATAITDPFEQALFLMAQLPYLQPFIDVNKRVSRLAANIPLIQANLCPLSFIDVPTPAYTDAMLAVYELQRIEPLRELLLSAYERSCQQYAAVKQSLQPPDSFRTRHRRQLGQVIAAIVRAGSPAKPASVSRHLPPDIPPADRPRFIELVLQEFESLHPDNAVRFGLRPLEVEAWQKR